MSLVRRDISDELYAVFQLPDPSIATFISIEREDGEIFAFTTNDKELAFGGLVYSPVKGIRSTSIKNTSDNSISTVDFDGIISSDIITADDIDAGIYRNALVKLGKVDYTDMPDDLMDTPSKGILKQFLGYIGKITLNDDDTFSVEANSLASRLRKFQGVNTQYPCAVARFCNNQCKLSEADYTFSATVDTVIDQKNFKFVDTHATGYYKRGIMRVTQAGKNFGKERDIKTHNKISGKAVISLRNGFPFVVSDGDTVELIKGCDRLPATCSSFENLLNPSGTNIENYRGQRFLPTNDVIFQIGRGK